MDLVLCRCKDFKVFTLSNWICFLFILLGEQVLEGSQEIGFGNVNIEIPNVKWAFG